MKILFCLNQDIYSCYFLNLLLRDFDGEEIRIYFSKQVGAKPQEDSLLGRMQKIEKNICRENVKNILKNSREKNFLTFEEIISKYQIPVFDFENINRDGYEFLKDHWKPDLIISVRFGQIFKGEIINLPKFGIINLHSGILPNYQGIMATFWAMKDQREEIGCTLHFISDSSIDTGDIIQINKIKADYEKSVMVNIFRLYEGGVKMVINYLDKIKNNSSIGKTKQNKDLGRYFSYPSTQEIKESNLKLIEN